MVFTAEVGSEAAQVIEIAEGGHVYCSRGKEEQENQFVEWGDLTPEQQQGLKKVQAILRELCCF